MSGGPTTVVPIDPLEARIVAGAQSAFARWGVRRSAVDDIAREAGVSRATVYRAFPGGRDAVAAAVLDAEVAALADVILAGTGDDLESTLVGVITGVARWFSANEVIRFVIAHEPDVVGPALAFDGAQRWLAVAADLVRPALAPFVAAERLPGACDWLVRLVRSHLLDPSAHVALADTASVRRLVTTFLLPALAPASN